MTRRKRHDLHATIDEERLASNKKCVQPVLHERSKCCLNLGTTLGFEYLDLAPNCLGCRPRIPDNALHSNWICRIDKERDPRGARHQLVQKTQPFGAQFSSHVVDAGYIATRPAKACHDASFHRIGTGGNGPVPTNRALAPRPTMDVNVPSSSPSLLTGAMMS